MHFVQLTRAKIPAGFLRLSQASRCSTCSRKNSLHHASGVRGEGYFSLLHYSQRGTGSRLPPRSAMDGRHRRPSPPFVPPTGERSHLPGRSALGKRHWRLTPPPHPLLRGVCLYLAASFANAKLDRVSCTKCNLTRAHIPPKGVLSPGYCKGVPKGDEIPL